MFVPQLLGVLLLTVVYVFSTQFVNHLQSSIPGSVVGLVFCAVAMLALPAARTRIRPGAVVLLGLVPLFLVPVLARMAVRIDFSSPTIWRALVMLCIASLVGVAATGLLAKLCLRKD